MSRAAHPLARLYRRPGGIWSDAVLPDPTAEITAGYGRFLQAVPECLRGVVEATLGALVRRHRRSDTGPWCTGCYKSWPCLDSAVLAAGLAPLTEEVGGAATES